MLIHVFHIFVRLSEFFRESILLNDERRTTPSKSIFLHFLHVVDTGKGQQDLAEACCQNLPFGVHVNVSWQLNGWWARMALANDLPETRQGKKELKLVAKGLHIQGCRFWPRKSRRQTLVFCHQYLDPAEV